METKTNFPTYRLKNINFPTYRIKNINFPTYRIKNINFSTYRIKNINFPSYRIKNINFPTCRIKNINFPTCRIKNINFPNESRRKVTASSILVDLNCHVQSVMIHILLYPLQRSCRGVYWFHHVRPSVDKSYFISCLPVKRGGSLSFLTIFTFVVPELLDLIWRKKGFLPYVVW